MKEPGMMKGKDMNPQMCSEMCSLAFLFALCAKQSCLTKLSLSCA